MKYIYPPRVENKIAPSSLSSFEEMEMFIAEPKLNGSSMSVYFSDGAKEIKLMNRHKEPILCKLDLEELKKLYIGPGEMILVGEYMNKNKKDETYKFWNIKFVIWDIIKLNSKHLIGTSFLERHQMLSGMYHPIASKQDLLTQITSNCFLITIHKAGFLELYDRITQIDMYEGLVLKKISGKLEDGFKENNNSKTQIKCRKETKNYLF